MELQHLFFSPRVPLSKRLVLLGQEYVILATPTLPGMLGVIGKEKRSDGSRHKWVDSEVYLKSEKF